MLFAALVASVVAQETLQCVQLKSGDVKALFNQWTASLKSCDPNRVAAMYWDHSILMPEFWPRTLSSGKDRINYFGGLLKHTPNVELVEEYADVSGCNQAQYSGIYQMTLTDPVSGQPTIVQSRFNFVFVTYDQKYWAIKTQMSSLMPGTPAISVSAPVDNDSVPLGPAAAQKKNLRNK